MDVAVSEGLTATFGFKSGFDSSRAFRENNSDIQ
jgi:hypothetical protein